MVGNDSNATFCDNVFSCFSLFFNFLLFNLFFQNKEFRDATEFDRVLSVSNNKQNKETR